MTRTLLLYVVIDLVALDIVGQPLTFTHDAPAVRAFTDALGDPQKRNPLAQHPKDFALVCIGEIVQDGERQEVSGYQQQRTVLTGQAWLDMQASGPQAVS